MTSARIWKPGGLYIVDYNGEPVLLHHLDAAEVPCTVHLYGTTATNGVTIHVEGPRDLRPDAGQAPHSGTRLT